MKKMMQQMSQMQGEEGMPDFSKMPGGLPGMGGKKFPFQINSQSKKLYNFFDNKLTP